MKKVVVISGANINMLGIREQSVYGQQSYSSLEQQLEKKAKEIGYDIDIYQSNSEADIINKLHNCYVDKVDGIVINPAAFTHYSIAIRDAISAINIPCIEVHISNVYQRESFRHHSVTAPVCIGQIAGFGLNSYLLALDALKNII